MCCTTLIAQGAATPTQLANAAHNDLLGPGPREQTPGRGLLCMSWILASDECSHRQLRMCWRVDWGSSDPSATS